MEPIKLRGIRVFLRGRARVQWKVLKSGESKTLKDDQYLLDDKALLWGRERQQQQQTFDELDETTSIESDLIQQQQTQILPKGLHELAFNFNLPPTQLPCSLETKAGTIRYYVKVLVDMPYASSPQGIKYFTLIGPHIDCLEEKYLSPLTGQDHKIRCQPCCRRGVVALRVILERSAYCCGEQIKLNLHLENRQECPTQICVKLIQNLEYRIDKGGGLPIEIKTIQSTALEWRSQFVLKHSQLNIDPNNFDPLLQLPTLPPTMIGFCRLIQLYYILKINVNQCPYIKNQKNKETSTSNNNNIPLPPSSSTPPSISSSESCLEMDFPLTIATVPFREIHSQFYSVVYDFCGGHVETGKYISPEFRLGQVWDGRIQENENNNNLNIEEIVLYRPVYVKIIGEQQQTEKALASNSSGGGGICRRQSTRIVGCSNNENNILRKQKEGQLSNGGYY